ncbi:hypothetical protein AAMO2058_001022400 [Amorphochlora amoebiformis]
MKQTRIGAFFRKPNKNKKKTNSGSSTPISSSTNSGNDTTSCNKCTFINAPDATKCAMCSQDLKTPQESKDQKSEGMVLEDNPHPTRKRKHNPRLLHQKSQQHPATVTTPLTPPAKRSRARVTSQRDMSLCHDEKRGKKEEVGEGSESRDPRVELKFDIRICKGVEEYENILRRRIEYPSGPSQAIEFMVIDVFASGSEMNLIGATRNGVPIHVTIIGFNRYFYLLVSPTCDLQALEELLETKVGAKSKGKNKKCVRIERITGKRPLVLHREGNTFHFAKITVVDPKLFSQTLKQATNLLGEFEGLIPDHYHSNNLGMCTDPRWCHLHSDSQYEHPLYCTYEAAVTHIDRFRADTKISGGSWVRVIANDIVSPNQIGFPCTITMNWEDINSQHTSTKLTLLDLRLDFAPLRVLSLALTREGEGLQGPSDDLKRVKSQELRAVTCAAVTIGWAKDGTITSEDPLTLLISTQPPPSESTSSEPTEPTESTEPTEPSSNASASTESKVESSGYTGSRKPRRGDRNSEPTESTVGGSEPRKASVGTSEPRVVDGGRVWWIGVESESDIAATVGRIFRTADPDILTGYEVASGDLKRLLDVEDKSPGKSSLRYISRVAGVAVRVKSFQTYGGKWVKQGRRMSHISNEESSYLTDFHGRVLLDVKKIVQGARKLETYDLQSSSEGVLGLNSSVSLALKAVSKKGGYGLAVWRSRASYQILNTMQAITDTVELGRATGLSLEWVWTKGQLARVWSLLLRECRAQNVLVTDRRQGTGQSAVRLEVGPLVLDCVDELRSTGLHKDPVIVLDFASMYPSIMIAHNLCFSTLMTGDAKGRSFVAPVKYLSETGIFPTICPTANKKGVIQAKAYRFAQKPKGILPVILRDLIQRRGIVKSHLKNATDPRERIIYDARQKALKVCANAVYGFTGTSASKVFVPALAETVLMTGVSQLLRAAQLTNQHSKNTQVIYGDTDSLMVKCIGQTVYQASTTGNQLSEILSDKFPDPCKMKLESIFFPFLLQHNKHYAGAENGKLTIKGMEAISRGTLPILRRLYNELLNDLLLTDGATSGKSKKNRLGVQKAVKRVIDTGRSILKGECSMEDLTLTRALWMDDTDDSPGSSGKGEGQYTMSQPHVFVAKKKRKRGETVRKGERISYVLVHTKAGGKKQWEMAEDPAYAKKKGLPLALRHYVDNLLLGPLYRLFELPGLLGKENSLRQDMNQMALTKARASNREAAEKAFAPLKLVGVKILSSPSRGIGKFFRSPKTRGKKK